MVTITKTVKVQKKDGSSFIVLELTGSVEIIQSQTTGRMYASVKRCRVPATFDESIANTMIGQQLEGEIVRVVVDPYEFVNQKTGELMQLTHSYAYRPKGSIELLGETKIQDEALVAN